MSNYVYANLIYGFVVLNDDGDRPASEYPPSWLQYPNGDVMSLEDLVARVENIQPPPGGGSHETYSQRIKDAQKVSGIKIVNHCRAEFPMWIIGITESHLEERRGYVGKLGQKIESKPEWREQLKKFCEKAGIPFTEPEWLLAPYSE